MSRLIRLAALLLVASLAGPAFVAAQALPTAPPDALGFAPDRLARLDAMVDKYVKAQKLPGVITLIMRDGKIAHLKSHGYADVEKQAPLEPTHLFRLASMSKAMTSAAVMILVEEGAITLADPVSKFIPSFKQTFVVVPPPPGAGPQCRARQRPGETTHHRPRPPHAHGRHLVWWRRPRVQVQGREHALVVLRGSRRDARGVDRSHCRTAFRVPAR